MAKGRTNAQRKRNGKSGRNSRVTKVVNMLSRREPYGSVITYNGVPTTAGAIVNLCQIPQGDSLNTRAGDKIFVEKMNVAVNILATATSNWRYIIFRDRFNLGTTPGVTDVITASTVSAPYSTISVVQQKRFTILMDKTISFSAAGKLSHLLKKTIVVNQPTFYTGSSATVNQSSGHIYLLIISDVATPGAHDFESQLIYSDF